jgi:hypothetical protein
MAKGLFTQTMAVLLQAPVNIKELIPLLEGFEIDGPHPAGSAWQISGPSLVLDYEPTLNGVIQIDAVDHRWPDSMGGLNEDPALFAAWGTGHFGPFCFPGSLERACVHNYTWREGSPLAARHQAFLRVRLSYDLEARPEEARVPKSVRPSEECEFMLAVVEALLEHPKALCYFNPNGETLAPLAALSEICDHYRKAGLPAINLLANRRMMKFQNSEWMMMDTVGMGQLDKPDLEVCFRDNHDPNEIAVFLVNTAMATARGTVYKDGHTVTGPKGVLFEVRRFSEPGMVPPREVLRMRPRDGTVSPSEMGFGDKPLGKRAWWEFWKL